MSYPRWGTPYPRWGTSYSPWGTSYSPWGTLYSPWETSYSPRETSYSLGERHTLCGERPNLTHADTSGGEVYGSNDGAKTWRNPRGSVPFPGYIVDNLVIDREGRLWAAC